MSHKYGNMAPMKTTIDLPEDLLRQAKATAALRGESLKELFSQALSRHLATQSTVSEDLGWKSVFGRARQIEIAEIDNVVSSELGSIESDSWR